MARPAAYPCTRWNQVRCPLKLRPGIFVPLDSALHVSFTWLLITKIRSNGTSSDKEMGHHMAWQPIEPSLALCVLFFCCAYGPALLLRAFFRLASGKRSDA